MVLCFLSFHRRHLFTNSPNTRSLIPDTIIYSILSRTWPRMKCDRNNNCRYHWHNIKVSFGCPVHAIHVCVRHYSVVTRDIFYHLYICTCRHTGLYLRDGWVMLYACVGESNNRILPIAAMDRVGRRVRVSLECCPKP